MLLCTPTALSPVNLTASSPTNLTASPPSNPTASPPLTLTNSHLPNLTASVLSLHLSSLPSPELTALPPTNFTACPLPHLTASFPLSSAHPHCPSSTQSLCLASPQTSSAPPLPHFILLRLYCLFSTHSLSLQQQLVTPMPVSSLFSQQFPHHLHHSTHYSFFSAPTLPYTFSHFHSLPCSFLFCSFLTLLSGGGRGDQREVRSPGPHPYPPGCQSIHDRTLYRACGAFTSLFHTITILGLLHSHYPLHTTAAATALLALLTPPQQPQQQLRRQRGTYLNHV